MYALDDNLQVAADEDRWDELIWEEYGIGDGVGPNRGEAKWTDEVTNGSFYVKRMISEHAMKCRNVGRAMQGIVDREEVLFRRERVKRMRIRQRESRERWGEALQTTTDVAT